MSLSRSQIILASFAVAVFISAAPGVASAQHCKLRYAEAFQIISNKTLAGQSEAQIKSTVANLFGPRQELCGESSYRFFLTEFKTYASSAFRKKGPEGEAMRLALREIVDRLPLQVRFRPGAAPDPGLTQLRSDIGVLASEVGQSPSVKAVTDALAKATPPKTLSRPMPADDDAIPVVVPRAPLPAWAVISLYEIRDHAKRKENGAIINKTQLILDWMARINEGAAAGDVKISNTPPTAVPGKAAAPAPTQAPAHP